MPQVKRRLSFFLLMMIVAIFLMAAAMIMLMTRPAWPSTSPNTGLPPGITCELVREKVAEHGRAVAWAWALKQGYSFAQIGAARRCLK
jgi:hypothetical protein